MGDHLEVLNNQLKESVNDFQNSARMSQDEIRNHISKLSSLLDNSNVQNVAKSLNKLGSISSDQELQRVSAEFNLLNKNFFQDLESHSKSLRRSLLQINNVVDQHNLQLMQYNKMSKKVHDQCRTPTKNSL